MVSDQVHGRVGEEWTYRYAGGREKWCEKEGVGCEDEICGGEEEDGTGSICMERAGHHDGIRLAYHHHEIYRQRCYCPWRRPS